MPGDETEFYRSLLADDPGLASVRAELAQSLLNASDLDGAIAESSSALAQDASLTQAWLVRGVAHKARHAYAAAAVDFEQAAALAPDRAAILINLANSYAEVDRLEDAERWLRRAVALAPHAKEAQASLGSVLVKQGRLAEAEAPCRAALALDPTLVSVHQNLSGILAASDPAAARQHRDAAYRRQQIFIEPGARPERTVLLLCAADAANVPVRHLLPREQVSLISWYVEYATADQDRALPPFDLVFNAIGDADLAPVLPPPVRRLLMERQAVVLNDPGRVARTARSDLPALLAGIDGVLVPPIVRFDGGGADASDVMAAAGLTLPLVARPTGAHGGQGVRRLDGPDDLASRPVVAGYLTQYIDVRAADGLWRKYRFIFVDGRAYPYHLAISDNWMVHYWTAGMDGDPARRAEEARFLADPSAAIGVPALRALERIAARLGLDFAGIDFAMAPDGRLVVFEANATMLVHPEEEPCFGYRNPAVQRIQAAFEAMLTARQTAAPHLPV